MPEKKFVIIDGNAIIHRAYHALPPMTVKGTMINAVYGFASMLLKVIRDLKPDYLAISFDVKGPTFRDKIYEAYKAKRIKADQELYDQIPLCYEVVNAFNIPVYTKKGYEADDVIATVASKCHPERRPKAGVEGSLKQSKRDSSPAFCGVGMTVVIVTGDMDLLQLVDEHIKVYALRKGMSDIVMFDEKTVKEKYGFGPEQIVDYKALRGDASDNIPGVPGIGEKTATELIKKFGSIEDIYKKIKKLKDYKISDGVIKKLIDGKEKALLSHNLATVDKNVPDLDFKLGDCAFKNLDTEKISTLFKKFEFWSLLKRLPGAQGKHPPNPPLLRGEHKSISPLEKGDKRGMLAELNKNNIDDFVKEIAKAGEFACKEILSGSDALNSELQGLVFAVGEKSYLLKDSFTCHPRPALCGGDPENNTLDSCLRRNDILKIFANKNLTLIGHDLKQLVKALYCHSERSEESLFNASNSVNYKAALNAQKRDPSSPLRGSLGMTNHLFDIMIASYILDSSTRAHDLNSIALRELGKETKNSAQAGLFGASAETIAEELHLMLEIKKKQQKQLEKMSDWGLFEKIEMPLIPILAEMELNGVKIDIEKMRGLSKIVNQDIEKITKKIWKEAGEEFNVASSAQLRDILFEKLKLPAAMIKKGKTGYSTAEPELEKLIDEHPIVPMILEHRELEKMKRTYVDVLPGVINKKTGRLHTSFNQAVTTTGRLSSSNPNLQNIPARGEIGKEIRNAFVAERGYSLISADYSQIELRIVASMAKDKKMIKIFAKGEDIHRATAAAINGVALDKVTKEMRDKAKAINFGVLYGMGAYGLSWRAGIAKWQAEEFIKKYFTEFSGVKKYIDETLRFAKKEGYAETLFGRRRYIPELKAENFQLRSAGERMAINMPIQGTAADLMKMAMIEINSKLTTENCKLILQVHDELVFEVKNGLEDETAKLVKNAMENVVKLNVPVEVHVEIGKRWGELK